MIVMTIGVNKFRLIALLATATFLLLLMSCSNRNPLKKDISGVDVAISFYDFEDTLMSIPEEIFFEVFPQSFNNFSNLFPSVLCDTMFMTDMLYYRLDEGMNEIYRRKQKLMPLISQQQHKITEVLKYYRFYYPEANNWKVYFHYSGMYPAFAEAPIIVADTLIVIYVDFFLGSDFEPYTIIGLPEYKRRWFEPEMISVELARQLALNHLDEDVSGENLLGQMVFCGKMTYFIEAMIPEGLHDTLKIRYSGEQYGWIKKHEKHVWSYIVSNKMLFASDQNHTKLFIKDSPFTPNFGESSPGRLGWWFGTQIVKKYIKRNPNIELIELINNTNSEKILRESGYKPG